MGSEILNAMQISAAGMRAQSARIRVISENLANANTTGSSPGADPYTRQKISFKNEMNDDIDLRVVQVEDISKDRKTPFRTKFMPDHPAADENGIVKMPNVNSLIEMMDAREAQRSYEANLGMIEQSRTMIVRTIDILR